MSCSSPLGQYGRKGTTNDIGQNFSLDCPQNSVTLYVQNSFCKNRSATNFALTRRENAKQVATSSFLHFNEHSRARAQLADVFPTQRLGSETGGVIRTRDLPQCCSQISAQSASTLTCRTFPSLPAVKDPFCRGGVKLQRESQRNPSSRTSDTNPSPLEAALFPACTSASPLLVASAQA